MSLMIFMFLCFAGLVVMFYFILRNQEKFYEAMRDEHAQMRVMLRVMDSRLAALTGETPQEQQPRPQSRSSDPLNNLSLGGAPQEAQRNNGLELHFDPQENIRRS